MLLSIFSCIYESVCLLWRNVCLSLLLSSLIGLFAFLILNYMNCLCILEINPLSVALFAIIFSHCEGCHLILFMVSFAVQKLLSLIRSHLFIFVFISITLEGGPKRILWWFMSWSLPPMFSSKNFIVSVLTFRSWIHFEFIFVYGVSVLISFFFKWLLSFPSTTYWKDCLFSIVYFCLLCQR